MGGMEEETVVIEPPFQVMQRKANNKWPEKKVYLLKCLWQLPLV